MHIEEWYVLLHVLLMVQMVQMVQMVCTTPAGCGRALLDRSIMASIHLLHHSYLRILFLAVQTEPLFAYTLFTCPD